MQVNYQALGPGGSMEYLTKVSPAIPALRTVKETVNKQFSMLEGREARHGVPDKEKDVTKLTASYLESKLYDELPGQKVKTLSDYAEDYITKGMCNLLESNMLADWFTKCTYERQTTEDWSTTEDS